MRCLREKSGMRERKLIKIKRDRDLQKLRQIYKQSDTVAERETERDRYSEENCGRVTIGERGRER